MNSKKTEANRICVPLEAAASDLFKALSDLEKEISSRFATNWEFAPDRMTSPLREIILASRRALARANGENVD